MDNSSSAEKICTQLNILLAQQKRLENDICQVKLTHSSMNATLDSVQNILMSTDRQSLDVKLEVDDTEVRAHSTDSSSVMIDQDSEAVGSAPPVELQLSHQASVEKLQMKEISSDKFTAVPTDTFITQSLWGKMSMRELKERHFGSANRSFVHRMRRCSDQKFCLFLCQSQSMFLTRVCESHYFQACVIIVILANIVFMIYEADLIMSNVLQGKKEPEINLQITNWVFCALFSIELGLKLAAYRCRFFWQGDWSWNVFDLLIVAAAVNDQTLRVFGREQNRNLTYLRVLRAFKMVRMLRVFRLLRFLREMRMLVENIMGSLKSMLWATILIAMVNFVFGYGFLQAATSFLRSNSEVDAEFKDELATLYGSTSRAMLTMYMSTTGGINWDKASETLNQVGAIYNIMFLVYISFFMFVVSNVVTSMFVDKALQVSSQDQQILVAQLLAKKQKYLKTVQNVFANMEKDAHGCLTMESFARHINDPEMLAFCEKIQVDSTDLERFFMALSGNGKRSVDLDTFVVGCIKLRGNARSADMMELKIEISKVHHGIQSLLKKSRDSSKSRHPRRCSPHGFNEEEQVSELAYDTTTV